MLIFSLNFLKKVILNLEKVLNFNFQWLQLKHAIPQKRKTTIKQHPGNVKTNTLLKECES